MSDLNSVLDAEGGATTRALAGGHTLVIGEADIELRSPEGDVEIQITVTDDGPVVKVHGGRLELEAPDAVTVRSRVFDVQTTEAARMHTDGQLTLTSGLDTRMVAEGEVHVIGKLIWLN